MDTLNALAQGILCRPYLAESRPCPFRVLFGHHHWRLAWFGPFKRGRHFDTTGLQHRLARNTCTDFAYERLLRGNVWWAYLIDLAEYSG